MTTSPADDSEEALVAEMRTYYGRRALVYDESMGYDDPDVVRALQPVVESLRREMHDRRVLEIACGPGFWTRQIAPSLHHITASDANESTLSVARTKGIDPERVTFLRADAYDLSSIDGAFDGALGVDFLAHVPVSRIPGFLDGLHGRLTPGARVAFCDQTPGPSSITGVYDPAGNHLQERGLPDGSRYRVIKHFFTDAEFRWMLAGRAEAVDIVRFSDVRRVVVAYSLPR
jgi:demethylmenaquinone methyltransferase/2-methoxy-6-polyprenyl-1,4-benzoquinol methylase